MKQYKHLYNELKQYWASYQGFSALIKSPFLHISLIITAISYPAWFNAPWWDNVISVIPSLLGFSLGGYAIWLAIGDEKFRSLIAGSEDGKISPFMELNYSFVHFILMQILAITFALIIKGFAAWWHWDIISVHISGAFGYLVFTYAIMCAFATVLAVARYSRWYDQYISATDNENFIEKTSYSSSLKKRLQSNKIK